MDADVIRLNVGGELYWTTRTTIQPLSMQIQEVWWDREKHALLGGL